MAVLRQENWLGQQRVDVPMLRAVESAVAADFDTSIGRIATGEEPVVVRGFLLANFGAGTQATSVQLATADSILCNINASQSGTFLWVPANRAVEVLDPSLNPRVTGSWTANQTNFVGLDLSRDAAVSTSDLVEFKNPNTNLEVAKEVPLARVLDYKVVITTTPFSAQPNLVPVAIVKTNGSNQVVSVTDARNMLFRLSSGGDNPTNPDVGTPASYTPNQFGWANGRAQTFLLNSFSGGDKSINSMRDLVVALENRIWEIGGGENWYSLTADRNVFMTNTGTTSPLADYFTWDGTNLLWIGLRFTFENSNYGGVYYNIVNDQTSASPGLTNLADGECIYVDLDRTANSTLTAVKTVYQTLGGSAIPGARQVIAVRRGSDVFTRGSRNPVGVPVPPATTTTLGIVKLFQTSATPLSPIVLNLSTNNDLAYTATGGTVGLSVTGVSGHTGVQGVFGGATPPGSDAAGVLGYGFSTAPGVYGAAQGNAPGVWGQGGTNREGLKGVGNGTGVGITATGGTSGHGATFFAGGGNKDGVQGTGTGSGGGGNFMGGPSSGVGVVAVGGANGSGALLGAGAGANVAAHFTGSPYITWDGNPASVTISDGTPWYRAMASAQIAIAWGYYTCDNSGNITAQKVWNVPATSGTLAAGATATFSLQGALTDANFGVILSTPQGAAGTLNWGGQTAAGGVGGAASFTIQNSSGSNFNSRFSFVIFWHA